MELGAADAAAERCPDGDLAVVAATRALAVLGELRPDLMKPLRGETKELDLGDRHHAGEGEPERGTDDAGLGERRIHNALGSESVHQPARGAEDPAQLADVEPEHHHAGIGLHLLGHRAVDGLDDVALSQAQPPCPSTRSARCRITRGGGSWYTFAKTSSGRGAGASVAIFRARSFSSRSSSVH